MRTTTRTGAIALLALADVPLGGAGEPPVVVEARLSAPADSHEPQRAALTLRNTGEKPTEGAVAYVCRFLGADGAVLERVTGSAPQIAGGASARAEALYYGWPRARDVACGLVGAPP